MNRLVIIGNGFDMAHGLKTSYMDFINWYWDQRVDGFTGNITKKSEDCLCKLIIKDNPYLGCWNVYTFDNSYFKDAYGNRKRSGYDVLEEIKGNKEFFKVEYSPFLERIMQSFETKRWVDIENDYYQLLKKCTEDENCGYTAKELNEQLKFLKDKLAEYLKTLTIPNAIGEIWRAIKETAINVADLSTKGRYLAKEINADINIDFKSIDDSRYLEEQLNGLEPENTMLLCFNYTDTVNKYSLLGGLVPNYIHGNLDHPEHIIFGYGDELDKQYAALCDKNDNELLLNDKSVKYLEKMNYRKMLDFLDAAPFQVLIMGHSCGNSDRTLLNTVFEHENCVSIKPYYHQLADGSDNFLEIAQNIKRNFTDPKLYRERVVNKELCLPMSKTIRCNFIIKVCFGKFINSVNWQQTVTVDLTEVQFDHYCDTLKTWLSTDEWKNRKVENGENSFIKRDLPDIYGLIKTKVLEKFPSIWEYKDWLYFDQIHIFTANEICSKVKAEE